MALAKKDEIGTRQQLLKSDIFYILHYYALKFTQLKIENAK